LIKIATVVFILTGDFMPSISQLGRKIIITGHYGSGKTEIAINLALACQQNTSREDSYDFVSLIDLDIVNPYFRSQGQRSLLESAGISLYGSMYDTEITAELPVSIEFADIGVKDNEVNLSGKEYAKKFAAIAVNVKIAVIASANIAPLAKNRKTIAPVPNPS